MDDITATVLLKEVPPDLILNWDQSGVNILPSITWTLEEKGKKWVEVIGANDKRQITAVLCGTLFGDKTVVNRRNHVGIYTRDNNTLH